MIGGMDKQRPPISLNLYITLQRFRSERSLWNKSDLNNTVKVAFVF